nr:hypothetical protein [Sphingobacterium sp. E70]
MSLEKCASVEANENMLQYNGKYGEYGGSFIPPVLESQLNKLAEFFDSHVQKEEFQKEFISILKHYVGRPSPLYFAKNLSEYVGSRIYLKRRI